MSRRAIYSVPVSLVLLLGLIIPITPRPSSPAVATSITSLKPTPTPPITITPETVPFTNWQDLPIIPSLSPEAIAIYKYGPTLGNNPRAFTKIGDGEISANWFLKIYDQDSTNYNLGPYSSLNQTIKYFSGSFKHSSQAAKRGYNTTKILDPKQADKSVCQKEESPLDCEIRIYKPSFALISMGTNQVWQADIFSREMRVILNVFIKKGIVPVLSTKADNLETDHRINIIITDLAKEYHLPVWNFWKICQELPNHGLQQDMEHLTYITSHDFTDKSTMLYAWPNRNLTALQVLEAVLVSLSHD